MTAEPRWTPGRKWSRGAILVARWTALGAAIALALLYLNGAAFSAWAGTGPPTTVPHAWMQRALTHLCYAVASGVGGFALFRIISRPVRFDRVVLVLIAVALVFIAAPQVRRFLLVDQCLDSGGRWDTEAFRCQK